MARPLRSHNAPVASADRTTHAQRGTQSGSLVMPRVIARAIDAVVVGVPVALVGTVLGEGLSIGFVVAAMLVAYLYETIGVARFGATAGKASMGLEIVDAATGTRPLVSKAGTRILFVLAVAGAIHLVVPMGPAAAVFLWGSATIAADGRGLPDSVAGTTVRRHR